MRKRNCDKLFDNILWYTIYLLPIILTFLMVSGIFDNLAFSDWQYIQENTSLSDYAFFEVLFCNLDMLGFGSFGIFESIVPLFEDELHLITNNYGAGILTYLNYFVTVFMFHLCVDFILFIPRLAHKWMKDFTQGD